MSLRPIGTIDLPEHVGPGGFDHAAVDGRRERIFVAHTANDAVDVIDARSGRYVRSVPDLGRVAGALVDEAAGWVFTSNRGENTVGIFSADSPDDLVKVPVGHGPNGLAFDPLDGILLCANVGADGVAGTESITLLDLESRAVRATVPMPGRTRWAVFDPDQGLFFVNVADPPGISVLDPRRPGGRARTIEVPARGPHGLDLDRARRRLYCACDEGRLASIHSRSGEVLSLLDLSGPPDVIFLNRARSRLYVAIGDPGVLDVIDVEAWRRIETVATEPGAHTFALDASRHRVYAFLPRTHRAAVFEDTP